MAMCASCHCYVEEAASSDLPEKSDDEEDMLDEAFHVTDDSRLDASSTSRTTWMQRSSACPVADRAQSFNSSRAGTNPASTA